ncbi:MAG: sialidase family protein [Chloroflexota bacterium]
MTTPGRARRAPIALMAGLLALCLPGVVHAEGDGEGESEGGQVRITPGLLNQSGPVAPHGEHLSGSAWLIESGLHPTLRIAGTTGWGDPSQTDSSASQPGAGAGAGTGSGGRPGTTQSVGGALVPYRDPGPAFSQNQIVTRDFGPYHYQTEPSIEVDPNDPEHLVLGEIDYNFPSLASYVSLDAGETWEGPYIVPFVQGDLGSGGDPVVAFDRAGNTYMAGISIGFEDFTVGPVATSAQVSSISVSSSADGGYTWPTTISSARSNVTTDGLAPDRFGRLRGNLKIGFLDKPWMVVGSDPANPDNDIIYVTYTDFEDTYSVLWLGEVPSLSWESTTTTIKLVRSTDGGKSWSDPVSVSPSVRFGSADPNAPADDPVQGDHRDVQGSQPAVAPDGTLTVAWYDSTNDEPGKGVGEIHIAQSKDGGKTFGADITASTFNEVGVLRNASFRVLGTQFPQLAVNNDGKVFIAYSAKPADVDNDDADVYIVSSDDGETFSRPYRLNDDDTTAPQFYPSIAISPNGTIKAMWGDYRDDPHQAQYQIYYTESTDGGDTWGFTDTELNISAGDTRASDSPSNPNDGMYGRFIGDYFSIAASDDEAFMVWTDTRLGKYNGPNMKIAFARKAAIPGPQLFLSPPSGPGGQQVTLQGFGYQPDMNVYISLGDSVIATARTDQDGQFQNVFYMPVTSQGSQTLNVVDESGSGASTSYFTEFGFGDIAQQYQDLSKQIADLKAQLGGGTPDASPAPAASPEASPAS